MASDEISDEEMLGWSGMRDETEGERERLTCFAMQEEQEANGELVAMSGGTSNFSYNATTWEFDLSMEHRFLLRQA